MTAQVTETFAIYMIQNLLFQGLHPCESLELTEEGSSSNATERRFRQGSPSPGQESSQQGVYGLAAQAT
jgi:hypothetical protein